MRCALLLTTSLLMLPGCWLVQAFDKGSNNGQSSNGRRLGESTPEEERVKLDEDRAKALEGDDDALVIYAWRLSLYAKRPEDTRVVSAAELATMTAEADTLLEQLAASPDRDMVLKATSSRAELWSANGRGPEGLALWLAVNEVWLTTDAASSTCKSARETLRFAVNEKVAFDDSVEFCARNHDTCVEWGTLHQLMEDCYRANPTGAMETALPWVSEAELAQYRRSIDDANAEKEAFWSEENARRKAEEEQAAASNSASSPSSAASPGPTPELKNNCGSTVKLFYGDKPKFGSGRSSSIGGNTRQPTSGLRPGDMLWIIDDSENGLASVTVSAGMKRIEITPSCTGFTTH